MGIVSHAPRFQLPDPPENTASRKPPRPQQDQLKNAGFVDLRPEGGILKNGFDLRGKQQPACMICIKQGLHPDPIPGKEQSLRPILPNAKRKDSIEPFQAGCAPLGIAVQHHLGV